MLRPHTTHDTSAENNLEMFIAVAFLLIIAFLFGLNVFPVIGRLLFL